MAHERLKIKSGDAEDAAVKRQPQRVSVEMYLEISVQVEYR